MKHIANLFVFLIAFLGIFPTTALAQGAAGMTIIPPKFELFANPGDIVTESIRLKNESNLPQSFSVLVEDFSTAGEGGRVVLEEDENQSTYSLKKWIRLSSDKVLLQPNQETVFPYSISVPIGAEPGGHYASVLFELGGSGDVGEGVTSVKHRIGSLVLLRVSGDVTEEATVESFSTAKYQRKGPVEFDLRVKNDGTTHIRPNGTIVIKNIFGRKVDEIPFTGWNVFPGTIREMITPWNKSSLLGVYTATMVSTYGQQNLPLTAATRFTVASPLSIILIIVGFIASIMFVSSVISGKSRLLKALRILTSG